MKVLEARLEEEVDAEAVARVPRETGEIVLGLKGPVSPCRVATAYLGVLELYNLGRMRVKSRALAVLMLTVGARQLRDVTGIDAIDTIMGVDVSPDFFESILERVTGEKWRGGVCEARCSPEDLAGVAGIVAELA